MTALAPLATTTLTLGFEKGGLIVVALLAAAVLALGSGQIDRRARAGLVAASLIFTPALLALALWNNPKLATLHHHPLRGVAAVAAVLLVIAVLAHLIDRHEQLLPLLAVAALPFRIPLGSVSSGLLLPLYAVVGAGAVVFIRRSWARVGEGLGEDGGSGHGSERFLAAVVLLYALQALYSPAAGVLKAVENAGFFYVPFALLFFLLRRISWNAELLRRCLIVLLALAAVFVLVGLGELADGSRLLFNRSLDQDAYFVRINSLFYDPNVYGRFLALSTVVLGVVMLFERRPRFVLAAAGALALMWVGLLFSLSQSSMAALLVGLAVAALGAWGRRAATIVIVLVCLGAGGAVAYALDSHNSANFLTSGRSSLVSRGVDLFKARPIAGYGSGSFSTEYTARVPRRRNGFEIAKHLPFALPTTSDSHTTPVTIAAEQGVVGLAAYFALLVACFWELFGGGLLTRPGGADWVARLAIAAAFTGLVVHTLFYADFLEDPSTWVLLAVGGALAASAARARPAPA
jgi:putative inorganic carbon (HCO3(-)) transporter